MNGLIKPIGILLILFICLCIYMYELEKNTNLKIQKLIYKNDTPIPYCIPFLSISLS